jgi:hypothetical protein
MHQRDREVLSPMFEQMDVAIADVGEIQYDEWNEISHV